jgi:hypothetical protein
MPPPKRTKGSATFPERNPFRPINRRRLKTGMESIISPSRRLEACVGKQDPIFYRIDEGKVD